ncbi:MAG: porin, partial [Verrucomicrobia bacterium]
AVMKLVHFRDIWIHIVAQLAGGLLAGVTFKFLNPTDI